MGPPPNLKAPFLFENTHIWKKTIPKKRPPCAKNFYPISKSEPQNLKKKNPKFGPLAL